MLADRSVSFILAKLGSNNEVRSQALAHSMIAPLSKRQLIAISLVRQARAYSAYGHTASTTDDFIDVRLTKPMTSAKNVQPM